MIDGFDIKMDLVFYYCIEQYTMENIIFSWNFVVIRVIEFYNLISYEK